MLGGTQIEQCCSYSVRRLQLLAAAHNWFKISDTRGYRLHVAARSWFKVIAGNCVSYQIELVQCVELLTAAMCYTALYSRWYVLIKKCLFTEKGRCPTGRSSSSFRYAAWRMSRQLDSVIWNKPTCYDLINPRFKCRVPFHYNIFSLLWKGEQERPPCWWTRYHAVLSSSKTRTRLKVLVSSPVHYGK